MNLENLKNKQNLVLCLLSVLLCSFTAVAQKPEVPSFSQVLNQNVSVHWLDKESRQFEYELEERGEDSTVHVAYYMGDTRTRKTRFLFADTTLHRLLTPFMSEKHLPLKGKVWLSNMHTDPRAKGKLLFTYKGTDLAYDLRTQQMDTTDLKTEKKPFSMGKTDFWKSYSADSTMYVYCIGYDLWLAHVERDEEGRLIPVDSIRLTTDGQQFCSFSSSSNSMRPIADDYRGSAIGKWMGKSHYYIMVREDKRDVGTLTLVNSLKERPEAQTYKFALDCDTAVSKFDIFMLDADKQEIFEVESQAYDDQMIDLPLLRGVTISGDNAYVVRKSRPQDQIDLLCIKPGDRQVRTLIHEECKPHLNEQLFGFHVLHGGQEILWWAERGDRGQWWLYDGEGKLKNAVTPTDMVAGEIVRIDTLGRAFIFRGFGREQCSNPAYPFYYRVKWDGKGLTLLTPGDGYHQIKLADGPRPTAFVDTYSRIDSPEVTCVRDLKGRLVSHLATADVSALEEAGWKSPRQIQVMADDGETPLYGVVYTPYQMKDTDRLPIISNPYPGPHTDLVPLTFTLDDNGNQTLANDGFIVICYSYRGSNPWRGRRFYTYGYGNLRDYTLDDDYATIRQVAEIVPQADTTRVGIYGHSGGGFVSTAAILTRPDFYKVAVSASGNHDNNIYSKWWGETFHGIRQETDSLGQKHWMGKIPTNLELAPRLKGHLLLIHGDMDNNVHPACTIRMANALIKAGKRFDMLIVPGVDHGLGDAYYNNTIRAYFREHLLGEKIPTDIKNLK